MTALIAHKYTLLNESGEPQAYGYLKDQRSVLHNQLVPEGDVIMSLPEEKCTILIQLRNPGTCILGPIAAHSGEILLQLQTTTTHPCYNTQPIYWLLAEMTIQTNQFLQLLCTIALLGYQNSSARH